MLKRLLQQIAPSFLLNYYKKKQLHRIIRDFQIKDEPDLIVIQKLLTRKDTIMDIGANIGLYIHFLAPHVKQVIAFEPVPFTFDILTHNAKKFNWQNIELHPLALSSKDGVAKISIPIQNGVRNYFRAALGGGDTSDKTFKVKTRTIDSFWAEKESQISFIKCDTEGHELSIINGASTFLDDNRPAWLIEISGDPDLPKSDSYQLCEIMRSYDYEIFFFERHTLHKRKEGDKSVNYFFFQDFHLQKIREKGIQINN